MSTVAPQETIQQTIAVEPDVTPEMAEGHGLYPEEYQRLCTVLGRTPTLTELGITSALWSEHCSYKSSKVWLKKLPTTGDNVVLGPGENAGAVDMGDGLAAVFKMESHNHPSFIEPYQGAATGVGGILRDVFTMGARVVALLNALRFGDIDHSKTAHLVNGVVRGIGGYGNCMGIPTVGGEVNFHKSYNGNILVNAMAVGLAKSDSLFTAEASGVGNPILYIGSKTGRDGIHGAVMSSAEFDDGAEQKLPTVQVGDPFTEKLLMEASLELMAAGCVIAIQDMGAAGLTSSAVEMASMGGLGIHLDLEHVPLREKRMTPYEIMLSESQERMLLVLQPDKESTARAILEKWQIDAAVIGHVTDTGRAVVAMHGKVFADLPVEAMVENAPEYNWPFEILKDETQMDPAQYPLPEGGNPLSVLARLLGCPDLCSRQRITQQYDSLVRSQTVFGPGGADAAVLRVESALFPELNNLDTKALALTTDCTPRYCTADPVRGGAQAVAESWRNLTAVGATPLGITDNMNFGNPRRPEIMGQFAGCIQGMAAACTALDYPVVSGNVSLNNETKGQAIQAAPVIGGVGVLQNYTKATGLSYTQANLVVIGIGLSLDHTGHLGQSLYLREVFALEKGQPPHVDLELEKRNGDCVRDLIQTGLVKACHDVSDGGLLVALAEMALASGIGMQLELAESNVSAGYLFGEDQARYVLVVTEEQAEQIQKVCAAQDVPVSLLGRTGGTELYLDVSDTDRHYAVSLEALEAVFSTGLDTLFL